MKLNLKWVVNKMCILLSDEINVSSDDLTLREELYNEFINLPKDFVSKMRHFQPQIGCFNNCSFCSKNSLCKSEFWDETMLRNVIAALKKVSLQYTNDDILLAWERKEHRIGVVFPYLDNDIGNYYYLDKYIELCYKELGVKTRISTVGFSRHNKILNQMHNNIVNSNYIDFLAGVRLSLSQYGRVWENKNSNTSLDEYEKDIANFLKIYKPYYNRYGSGPRKMCVEIRFNPLVVNDDVFVEVYNEHYIIAVSNYLFVSKDENIHLKESHIIDPFVHSLKISEKPIMFYEYAINEKINSKEKLFDILDNLNLKDYYSERELYLFKNLDGEYYSFDPKLKSNGNYGINIYPKTIKRHKSGYLITERFLLNSLYAVKNKNGLTLKDKFDEATWNDADCVLDHLMEQAMEYKKIGKLEKYKFILEHVIPIVNVYINSLKIAKYNPSCFFDKNFTIDTGTICNLGRAIKLFKGITNHVNEPLTPTNERNYGRYCSTMKQENYVWRLSCGFNNSLIIEKLDLFNTANDKGQVSYKKVICLDIDNKTTKLKENEYLFPGVIKNGSRIL